MRVSSAFKNEDGTHRYYATFTAYDGRVVMPELVETSNFLLFRFITLNGAGRAKQRHGAVPAQDQRPLCHAFPPGQRKHLSDVFR